MKHPDYDDDAPIGPVSDAKPTDRPDLAQTIDEALERRGSMAYVSGVMEYPGGTRYVAVDGAYDAADLRLIADILDPPWWTRFFS